MPVSPGLYPLLSVCCPCAGHPLSNCAREAYVRGIVKPEKALPPPMAWQSPCAIGHALTRPRGECPSAIVTCPSPTVSFAADRRPLRLPARSETPLPPAPLSPQIRTDISQADAANAALRSHHASCLEQLQLLNFSMAELNAMVPRGEEGATLAGAIEPEPRCPRLVACAPRGCGSSVVLHAAAPPVPSPPWRTGRGATSAAAAPGSSCSSCSETLRRSPPPPTAPSGVGWSRRSVNPLLPAPQPLVCSRLGVRG